jgi:hypothetical protein
MQEYATKAELVIAKEFVAEQLDIRSFTEHPEDRDELMYKAQVLDIYITKHPGDPCKTILPLPNYWATK